MLKLIIVEFSSRIQVLYFFFWEHRYILLFFSPLGIYLVFRVNISSVCLPN